MPLRQQQLKIFSLQIADKAIILRNDGRRQIALSVLQFQNLFLNSVAGNHPVGEDGI